MPVQSSIRRTLARRLAPLALIIAVGGALSGCSWFRGDYDDGKCPVVAIPDDLSHVTQFKGPGTDFANATVTALLTDIKGGCTFDKGGVTVDMNVSLVARLGPAATDRNADFAYFVAILNQDGKIVAKQLFPAPIAFAEGQSRRGSIESITQRIPLQDYHDAGKYRVEVGFQLSQEELTYNRGGH
ncbi:MAG TPA: hypothetical protein VKQ29_09010 [Aliidongia sp.]|nr:hypothetical protein [Aliidongia sp.]